MTTTLERSLSRNSNMSIPLSSPRFSIQDDSTTPEVTDPDLSRVYSRLNGIDSNVLDIRSSVITKDSYVDRRNREDQHIRREFDTHRAIYTRIDVNVVAIRSDVDQLKSEIFQVKSSIRQSGTDTALLRSDLDHLQKKVDQIQEDLDSIRSSVSGSYVETTRLKASVYQLRTEMLTLHNETTRQLKAIESRMDNFENRMDSFENRMGNFENRMGNFETRMRLSDRVRFNSLAHATHAPITPVPMIDIDGTFRFPGYFPKTVWRFWCLKKRSRVHRLIELADFYQIEGYQYWRRIHHQPDTLFGMAAAVDDGESSDSSDSSDANATVTRADAVRQFPEAAHQALAATLGLVYTKIRKEVGEGCLPARPPKRNQEEVISNTSSTKQKSVKIARGPSKLPASILNKLVAPEQASEHKSQTSEESDKLGWNANLGDGTESVARIVAHDIRRLLQANEDGEPLNPMTLRAVLQGMEEGLCRAKPSPSELQNMSPTERARFSFHSAKEPTVEAVPEEAPPTDPRTPSPRRERRELPDTASEASTP